MRPLCARANGTPRPSSLAAPSILCDAVAVPTKNVRELTLRTALSLSWLPAGGGRGAPRLRALLCDAIILARALCSAQ